MSVRVRVTGTNDVGSDTVYSDPVVIAAAPATQWTQRASGFGADAVRGVAYGNGTFVAVGNNGKIALSGNAFDWELIADSGFGADNIYGVAYGAGLFVAVGANGKAASSVDGEDWTDLTGDLGVSTIYDVIFNAGVFAAVTDSGDVYYSADAETWIEAEVPSFGGTSIRALAGNGPGDFLVTAGIQGKIATAILPSTPSSWVQRSNPLGSSVSAWGATRGENEWIVVGTTGAMVVSPDGITWATQATGFSTDTIFDVAYHDGTYVAVGANGKMSVTQDKGQWNLIADSSFSASTILSVNYVNGLWIATGVDGKIATANG